MFYILVEKMFLECHFDEHTRLLEILLRKNLIREVKIHQIASVMQTAQREGMITMEKSIEGLIGSGIISNAENKI